MASKIDEIQVRRVAKLARLDLTDDEVARFSTQLSAILGYVEKLNELDTDSVEPLAHCLPIHKIPSSLWRIACRFTMSSAKMS
jgi:aspartyl-tRNA(Asn)/glutamyl-tRNA(Gln) amidotransferase subunit C